MAPKKPYIGDGKAADLGNLAGDVARKATIDACVAAGLTVEKVAKTVVAALDAKQVKVQLNQDTGEFAVSQPFTDHVTQLKAVEQSIVLLDLKPTERKKIDMTEHLTDEEVDRRLDQLLTQGKKGKK